MAVTLPGVYEVIYEYENIDNPSNAWRNTFAFSASTPPTASDHIITSLNALTNSSIHSDSRSVKVSCYNWARGRQPYPLGEPLFTFTQSVAGVADTAWHPPISATYTPVGKEVCMRIDHEPVTGGKPGRSFFRLLYGDADIIGNAAGLWETVSATSAYQSALLEIIAGTGVDQHLSGGSSAVKLVVVRYTAKPTPVVHGSAVITALTVIGPTTNKVTRKNRR